MGQQQLLLIILGVIIVGIAIAVGLSLFSANAIQGNKDAIIGDLQNLSSQAYSFKVRPSSMGGGQGAYTGFTIPTKLLANPNATYEATVAAAAVTFVATSAQNTANKVTAVVDSDGKLGSFTFAGDFQ
jgi:hypothetical protein